VLACTFLPLSISSRQQHHLQADRKGGIEACVQRAHFGTRAPLDFGPPSALRSDRYSFSSVTYRSAREHTTASNDVRNVTHTLQITDNRSARVVRERTPQPL
jgi:hypothetical protein